MAKLNRTEGKKKHNEFLRNHPFLYIVFALAAFFAGNYLFDLIAQIF